MVLYGAKTEYLRFYLCIFKASVCMEREEDAKALAECKNLKIRGRVIEIYLAKVCLPSFQSLSHLFT